MKEPNIKDQIAIFTGNANPGLAQEICNYLNVPLGNALVGRFPDGEIHAQINDNIRGKDVFIVQSTSNPTNDHLMELLIMIDAVRRASAKRITAVLPFYGYARQDRKDRPRVPITAKLVANLIVTSGANRVLSMDLHAGQIQGFFDIPVDHLYSINILVDYFLTKSLKNVVVVSPDVGGIKMARAYAKRLDATLAIVDKRRVSDKETQVMNLIGEVKGSDVVIVDDLVSTGGSLVEAVKALKKEGAQKIYAAITHPVLAGTAVEKIEKSDLEELVVSNSIPVSKIKAGSKIKVLSVAPLLGEAIRRIHLGESVSSLFSQSPVEA